jgi:hypothetical protein
MLQNWLRTDGLTNKVPYRALGSRRSQKGKICEITGAMLMTPDSTYSDSPRLKSNPEIWEVLGISNQHFLRKAEITSQLKKIFKALVENYDFSKKKDPASIPLMFSKVKKGSQTYRNILLANDQRPEVTGAVIKSSWLAWQSLELSQARTTEQHQVNWSRGQCSCSTSTGTPGLKS